MEFNNTVKKYFFPIIQKFGFKITEEFKNILHFQSSTMKLNVAFNDRENTYFVEIGRKEEFLYPINCFIIEEVFKCPLSIENIDILNFVRTISTMFMTESGISLLQGNIDELKRIVTSQSDAYTSEVSFSQTLEIAADAWQKKNYFLFIDSIDKVGLENVPHQYQLKYKIANQRCKN